MPVIEFLTIDVSQAFQDDNKLAYKVIDELKKTEGYISTFYGFQQEDKQKGYIAVVWETYEHHAAIMQSKSYSTVVEAFGLLLAGSLPASVVMDHVEFSPDPSGVLAAPTTEVAFITLKPGEDKEALDAELATLTKGLDACKGAHPPCSWGVPREREDVRVLLVGWDSAQAHTDSVYGPGGLTDVVGRIGKLANVSFAHTTFNKAL